MVSHGNTHTSGDVIKEKTPKRTSPTRRSRGNKNRSYKYGSKDEKSARHPFHPNEWYII